MLVMGPDKVTRSVQRPLEARMRSAAYAAMAYWYYEWDWGEAIAYDGIDETADALDDVHLRSFVDEGVRRWAELDPAASLANRMGPVACGTRRLRSDDETSRTLERALRSFGDAVTGAPRSATGAFLLDSPSPMIFVDTLYAEPAALAELGAVTGTEDYQVAAVELCRGHIRHLQDRTSGMFRHYCDTTSSVSPPILWGRGNGWAILGLADTIAALGESEVIGADEVLESFQWACSTALELQAPGSGWRNIVDDPASNIESSTSAMVTTALLIGVRIGALDPDKYLPAALDAWQALAHRIDANGHFIGVSFRPGLNSDPSRYEHVPFAGNLPWGQGAYLRLAAERLRHPTKAS